MSNDKTYQPPQARNEHVNVIFTRSGKTYDPPPNLNDKTIVIINDSDDETEEANKEDNLTPSNPKNSDPPPVKAYKAKVPYPQCLRKEKKYPQQVDYNEMIEESVQEIINEVKNQLPKFLPKAVSDFATPMIQIMVKNALKKIPLHVAQSSSQAPSSLKAAKSLSEYELKTILFDKMDKSRSYLTHDKHQVLFDALLNSILLDDVVARGQADLKKDWFKKPPRPPTPD
ncbi:hypothetical protein Tco_0596442 [Tanacetum coccineum]